MNDVNNANDVNKNNKMNKVKPISTSIFMTEELHKKLIDLSVINKRSMSAQIRYMLEKYIEILDKKG